MEDLSCDAIYLHLWINAVLKGSVVSYTIEIKQKVLRRPKDIF